MNSKRYWLRRFIQEKAIVIKNAETYEMKLNARLDGMLSIFDAEIKKYYKRYAYNFDIPEDKVEEYLKGVEYQDFGKTIEQFKEQALDGGFEKELNGDYYKSQVARLRQLESQLKQKSKTLFSIEQFKMRDEMINEYKHTYYHNIYEIQGMNGEYKSNFNHLNDEMLENLVYNPWAINDKNFSQRLWGIYTETLPNALMNVMLRNALIGSSSTEMTTQVHEKFKGMKRQHVHRLVVTELMHSSAEATAEAYKSQDISKYKYIATLESHTCSNCRALDGQIFLMSDRLPGTNYPTIHPWCRCTTAPYIDGMRDSRTRWSETGTTHAKTFGEWAEMNGIK